MSTSSDFLAALKATSISYVDLAKEARVSQSWLYAVAAGDIKEPSLAKAERVLAAISNLSPKKKKRAA